MEDPFQELRVKDLTDCCVIFPSNSKKDQNEYRAMIKLYFLLF